jgi:ADP-heptose:LPS heptosyltransferase
MDRILRARRPAVYFANKVGDSLLTLPTLRALARTFDEPITLISTRIPHDLCFHEVVADVVDITHLAPPTHLTPLPVPDGAFDEVAARVGDVDLFVNLVPYYLSSNEVAQKIRGRLGDVPSVGFRSEFDSYDVAIRRDDRHSADLIFQLAQLFDPALRIEDFSRPPSIAADVVTRARAMRAEVPSGQRVLVVHADTDWTAKQWPVTRFVRLLDVFLSRHPEFVAWVVGMGHEELDVGREGGRVHAKLGLPLDLTMALVATADIFCGIDSSMLHAADLARVPGVGLFGPTRSSMWGFRFGPHEHVDRAAMADITVDDAADALERLASS